MLRIPSVSNHHETIFNRGRLARAYLAAGRVSDAVKTFENAIDLLDANIGTDHPDNLEVRNHFTSAYFQAGRSADGIRIAEETLRRASPNRVEHPASDWARQTLAKVYLDLDRLTDCEALFRPIIARRRNAGVVDKAALASDLGSLGFLLIKQSRWREAEPLLRECLALREEVIPDQWWRFNAQSALGAALLGQDRYVEAEPLVIRGYDGMKARESQIPAPQKYLLQLAADRLVRLYEQWGKPDRAADWKRKLSLEDLPADPFSP